MKKLIVNADDFGQSEGINRGIIQAYEEGIVTSTSLMVRYPAAFAATEYAGNDHHLGIGIHIDLGEWVYRNEGWEPIYQVVPLDDTEAVRDEVERQIGLFYEIIGKKPTHMDSHQHVHQGVLIRPLFVDVARKLDITLRGCSGKVRYCGDFYGQMEDGSPFYSGISIEGLTRIITHLPDGITELSCHPGFEKEINTMYKLEREMEVHTLCYKGIREAIDKAGIELCSFEEIPFA